MVVLDFMLAAAAAALLNIGLLGGVIITYIQNMRLIKSYFTIGLVLVASATLNLIKSLQEEVVIF